MATVLVVDDDRVVSHLKKLKMSTRTQTIPVIILSGSIDAEGQERVRSLGADAVLSKPLVPEELFEALTKAL
jgi:CheY-like chemotaxis protein